MKRALCLALAAPMAACGAAPPANESASVDVANDVARAGPTNDVSNTPTPPFAEVPGAHPTAPEPAPIPARFRGTWAEDKAACADLKHHSRLGISGRTVRFPDFVIFSDSVEASGNQFSLKGKIEGTDRPAEAQYFINETGDTLTDGGGAVRVRCG